MPRTEEKFKLPIGTSRFGDVQSCPGCMQLFVAGIYTKYGPVRDQRPTQRKSSLCSAPDMHYKDWQRLYQTVTHYRSVVKIL